MVVHSSTTPLLRIQRTAALVFAMVNVQRGNRTREYVHLKDWTVHAPVVEEQGATIQMIAGLLLVPTAPKTPTARSPACLRQIGSPIPRRGCRQRSSARAPPSTRHLTLRRSPSCRLALC